MFLSDFCWTIPISVWKLTKLFEFGYRRNTVKNRFSFQRSSFLYSMLYCITLYCAKCCRRNLIISEKFFNWSLPIMKKLLKKLSVIRKWLLWKWNNSTPTFCREFNGTAHLSIGPCYLLLSNARHANLIETQSLLMKCFSCPSQTTLLYSRRIMRFWAFSFVNQMLPFENIVFWQ